MGQYTRTVKSIDIGQYGTRVIGLAGSSGTINTGEVAPADAGTNQLWYKPSTGSLYLNYNDGDSTQWIEIGGLTT
jgi:hypothetical protein